MKLIHIAFIRRQKQGTVTLYLYKISDQQYTWFEKVKDGTKIELPLGATTIEEAMRIAHRELKKFYFRTLNCGFRYSLPERDEHGINALYWQMAASYNSPGGVYFDEEVGYNCFVQNSSLEALKILREGL